MTTLPSKAKVVIIGGGIHGLSTAWKLSETYKNPDFCKFLKVSMQYLNRVYHHRL